MTQRYEVKGKLGHGGLGEVHLAYDTQLDREVALKRVRPQEDSETGAKNLAADLVREAKTLSALQHPNIVTIYDVGTDAQGPFVIMEYLKGETLDQVIERGRVTVDDFREIVLQTMEGMVAAGSMGLVHRDLKPGNIMVNWLPTGKIQLKILDFGLAKFSQTAVPQTQDQGAGIFGSIFFMAPEQFERLPLDARTDLYSLGCIFYQLLTGKHPFGGRTPVDVMVSHLQHLVTPLHEQRTDVPQWMADWVMWLISREMEQRPGDARTAMQYFMEGRSGLPAPSRPQPTQPVAASVKQPQVPRPNVPTQHVPGHAPNVAGFRARPGTHASASRSRGRPRRVDGHVKGLPKERVHWITVVTGLVILGIAGIAGYKIYQKRDREKEDPRLILKRYEGDAPEGDSDAVAALLKLAASDEKENLKDVETVLKKIKGESVPLAIASEIEGTKKGPMRDMILRVAGYQPSKEVIAQLTKVAGDDLDIPTRVLALESLTRACTADDVVPLLNHAVKFQEEPVRTAYYKTIETLLGKEADRDRRVEALAPALKSAGPSSQPAIYRLIGATNSPVGHKVLAAEISAAGDRRRAALEALKSWNAPDIKIAEALIEAARTGDHDSFTGPAARTIARVPALQATEVVANLRKLAPYADTPLSRRAFAAGIGTLGSKEGFDFVTEMANSPDAQLASSVKEVLEKVTKQNANVVTLNKGENVLDASKAVLLTEEIGDVNYNSGTKQITGWRSSKSRIAWDIVVPDQAKVEVEVVQSTVRPGNSFFITIATQTTETDAVQTKTSEDFMRVNAGTFDLFRRGSWRVYLEPGRMTEQETFLNVKSVIIRVK